MKRRGKKGSGSAARTAAGAALALAGVGVAVVVALASGREQPTASAQKPSGGLGGPALSTDGRTVAVGAASSIPQAQLYDTGPINTEYNPRGWDTAWLGGR